MPLIRVGLVGLNPADPGPFRGGNWGVQHLHAINASPDYTITAVCNSTIGSAQKALEVYNIPNAKAYGDAAELAKDPNVDLVVVSVFADHHYSIMKPALLNKKDVYVEFVIAKDAKETQELYDLAKANGCKVVVGAQGTADPALRKIHELVRDKVVGDVVLSSFTAAFPVSVADGWLAKMEPFLDVESSIARSKGILGHILCHHTHTLGKFNTIQAVLKVNEKTAVTLNQEYEVLNAARPVTAPDTFAIQGVLQNGAVASVTLRTSRKNVDDVGYRWLISGTKGEIEFSAKPAVFQNANFGLTLKTRLWNGETEEVAMSREEPEWLKALSDPVNGLARVYDNFAKGDEDGYVTFEEGLHVHHLLDEIHRDAVWAP